MPKNATIPSCPEILAVNARGWPNSVTFNDDGSKILAAGFGSPTIFDATTGVHEGRFVDATSPNSGGVCWALACIDSKQVVGGVYDAVAVWTSEGTRCVRTVISPQGIVSSVAITPDRKTLVFGTWEKHLVCVDFHTGNTRWDVKLKTSFSGKVAITLDGKHCITAGNDKTVRLFDLRNGAEIHVIGTHTGYVQGLAVLPDGKRALTASRDKTICLWDIHKAKLLATLSGHRKEIRALGITMDGRLAISAGGDGAKVWDLASHTAIATFNNHGKSISCLSILGNTTVVTGADDGHLRIWRLP
ncbi:MAG: WD40 repeat domain-containing protein [Planctomycetia bacterium]|nr:WD40 repeat domain-containing protein [Planctomycetia bacterium]